MYTAKMRRKNQVKSGFKVPGEWTFRDRRVARAFDSHVREQLPWYDLATGIVAHVARHYVPQGGTIIDVGASTGNIGRALADVVEKRCVTFIPIDSSPDMLDVYDGPGRLEIADAVAFDFAPQQPDLVICFLALMFVPVKYRRALVERIVASIHQGGAVIVFDKVESRGGYLGTISYRLALAAKHEAGASADEVIAKELSLAGIQRPMKADELDGFVEIFRFGDFAGFVREC